MIVTVAKLYCIPILSHMDILQAGMTLFDDPIHKTL